MSTLKPYQHLFLSNLSSPSLVEVFKTIIFDLIIKGVLEITSEGTIVKKKVDNLDRIETNLTSSLELLQPIKIELFLKEASKYVDIKFKVIDKKYDFEREVKDLLIELGYVIKKKRIIGSTYAISEDAEKLISKGIEQNDTIPPKEVLDLVTELNSKMDSYFYTHFLKGKSGMGFSALQYLK